MEVARADECVPLLQRAEVQEVRPWLCSIDGAGQGARAVGCADDSTPTDHGAARAERERLDSPRRPLPRSIQQLQPLHAPAELEQDLRGTGGSDSAICEDGAEGSIGDGGERDAGEPTVQEAADGGREEGGACGGGERVGVRERVGVGDRVGVAIKPSVKELVLVFEGRRDHVSLRAKLRESLDELELLRVGARGACKKEICKERREELGKLKAAARDDGLKRRRGAEVQVSELRRKLELAELANAAMKRRRKHERGTSEAVASLSASLREAEQKHHEMQLERDEADAKEVRLIGELEKKNRQLASRCEHAKRSLRESAAKMAVISAEQAETCEEVRVMELEREADAAERDLLEASEKAEKRKLLTELNRLRARSAELASLRHAASRTGVARGEYLMIGVQPDADDLRQEKPSELSPTSKARRRQLTQNDLRLRETNLMRMYEAIGEGCDPELLGEVLESTDMIDKLMETPYFWERRIAQAQGLMDNYYLSRVGGSFGCSHEV